MKEKLPYRFTCPFPVIPSGNPIKFTPEQQKEIDESFERALEKLGIDKSQIRPVDK